MAEHISDKELVAELTKAIAEAKAAAAAANTAAASANQASAGAAGGVAGARTQSNVEQASISEAVAKFIANQVDSDIDSVEAWKSNLKRTYDVHQTYDMEGMLRNRQHYDTLIANLNSHLADVHHLSLQALSNNQNQSNMNNTLAIDRAWNINETDLAAKSAAVLTDTVLSGATKVAAMKEAAK